MFKFWKARKLSQTAFFKQVQEIEKRVYILENPINADIGDVVKFKCNWRCSADKLSHDIEKGLLIKKGIGEQWHYDRRRPYWQMEVLTGKELIKINYQDLIQ